MELPEKLVSEFKQVLVQGGAFRKYHSSTNEPEKNRFFFVLNKNPSQDKVILVATSTTKIEQHKNRFSADVLIELTTEDFAPLPKTCLINCERAFARTRQDFEKFITEKKIEVLWPLGPEIIERIERAVKACKLLPDEDKQLVLGDNFKA